MRVLLLTPNYIPELTRRHPPPPMPMPVAPGLCTAFVRSSVTLTPLVRPLVTTSAVPTSRSAAVSRSTGDGLGMVMGGRMFLGLMAHSRDHLAHSRGALSSLALARESVAYGGEFKGLPSTAYRDFSRSLLGARSFVSRTPCTRHDDHSNHVESSSEQARNHDADAVSQQPVLRYHVPISAYYVGREVDFSALARDYGAYPHRVDADSLIVHLGVGEVQGKAKSGPALAALKEFWTASRPQHGRLAAAAKAKAAAAAAAAAGPTETRAAFGASATASAEPFEEIAADGEDRLHAEDYMPPTAAFAVVYDFGGLVLFNVTPEDHAKHITLARKHAAVNPRDLARRPGLRESVASAAALATTGAPPAGSQLSGMRAPAVDVGALCSDSFGVVVSPTMENWCEFGEYGELTLQRLDAHNVSVIASVLAQSVALDHYANRVDGMLEEFKFLNHEMERTGSFTMRRERLFQIVATVNSVLADVITRLGVLERSDTAWKFANYERVWSGMRDDFEINARFDALNTKMSLIQDNVKYFLEVLQNRKSDTLEWIIIVLISAEICVSLFDIFTR